MTKEQIARINELARKQKVEGLTEEEKAEQLKLRGEYINAYKQSLIAQLENTYILEPDGTKRKVRRKAVSYTHLKARLFYHIGYGINFIIKLFSL